MQHDGVTILRRAYKRGQPIADIAPVIALVAPSPRWLKEAYVSGEVRCPRKFSVLSIEICAQIQGNAPAGCIGERCRFYGHRAAFEAEVARAKDGAVAPKTGARGKRLKRA